jgi:hypothetical protein
MVKLRHDDRTLDLLSWEPPAPVAAFPEEKVRAADLRAMIAKAVSLSLKDCGKSRAEIASEMSAYLGEATSEHMLNAYASEAREEHVISIVRFIGLAHATGDAQRLLQLLADRFDLAVIPARYLAAIDDAVIADKIDELKQRQQMSRRSWKDRVRCGGAGTRPRSSRRVGWRRSGSLRPNWQR